MKRFQFLAKQGQSAAVCRLLTNHIGKPRVSVYSGPRGKGVMITLILPTGWSKRQVDRLLYNAGIPGAVARKNRFLIVGQKTLQNKGLYDLFWKIGSAVFLLASKVGLRKARISRHTYCECCGPVLDLDTDI